MKDADSVPPFRPEAFQGDHQVTVWKPGTEVVLLSYSFGPLSKTVAVVCLCAPAIYLWLTSDGSTDDSGLLALGAIFALIGLLLGIHWLVRPSAPRMVRLDWGQRTLSIRDDSGSAVISMADITAIELDRQHRKYPSSGGDEVGSSDYHCCEVRVHWRGPHGQPTDATLLKSSNASEPEAPYHETLPLVTDLARSLRVERRITDSR